MPAPFSKDWPPPTDFRVPIEPTRILVEAWDAPSLEAAMNKVEQDPDFDKDVCCPKPTPYAYDV